MVGVALYLPWFLWTWAYYGTPVSNTIRAKSVGGYYVPVPHDPLALPLWFAHRIHFTGNLIFTPGYFDHGGWPRVATWWNALLCVAAFGVLFLPGASRMTRTIAASFTLLFLYYCFIPYAFPWYLPTGAWVGYLALIAGWVELRRRMTGRAAVAWEGIAVAAVAFQAAFFIASAETVRVEENVVEKKSRTNIGLWLRDNAASPQDTVFLEPLGYVGYYSGLRMYDFPGLAAPNVVEAQRRLKTSQWNVLIRDLKPTWLVLRAQEVSHLNERDPELLSSVYRVATVFDVSADLAAAHVYGKGYINPDRIFTVYHRNE